MKWLIIVLSLTLSTSVLAAKKPTYLCIEEASTGFSAKDNWAQRKFNTSKYLVKYDSKRKQYLVTEFGEDRVLSECESRFNKSDLILLCEDKVGGVAFTMHSVTNTFTSVWRDGYFLRQFGLIDKKFSGFSGDMALGYGKCSKI